MGPQEISTAKKGKDAEFIRKNDGMEGILLIEYMKKGSTITGEVYKETIRMLKTAIQQKKLHNCDQKMMLLRDNCRVRKSCQVSSIDECGFPEMEHPP
jgi:hypothetical protein